MQLSRASDAGALVRRYRQRAGLSQQQLAERLRITRQLLSRFEQGKSDLPFGVVLQALRELDASMDVRTRAERAGVIEVAVPRPLISDATWSAAISAIPRLDSTALAAAQRAVVGLLTAREATLRALRSLPSAHVEEDRSSRDADG